MVKKQKGSPPSRRRYEEVNPVASCRVPRKVHERLEAVKKSTGASMAKVLMAGLGLFEVKVRAEEEIRQQAYDEGWEKGVNSTWDLLAVTYPCAKCGKEMTVTTEEEKKAIRKFMIASGWHHGDCNHP